MKPMGVVEIDDVVGDVWRRLQMIGVIALHRQQLSVLYETLSIAAFLEFFCAAIVVVNIHPIHRPKHFYELESCGIDSGFRYYFMRNGVHASFCLRLSSEKSFHRNRPVSCIAYLSNTR